MGKKFIKRLSWKPGTSSKSKTTVGDNERWMAFESRLAQRMNNSAKDKSKTPAGGTQKTRKEEAERSLLPPSRVLGRSETASPEQVPISQLRPPPSPQRPPISPRHEPSSPRHAPSSPSHSPTSPSIKPQSVPLEPKLAIPDILPSGSFRNSLFNRKRAGSEGEASFASGRVKIVPTGSFSDSKAIKTTQSSKSKDENTETSYNWKAEQTVQPPSDEETLQSSHGYTSDEDSITYYTRETANTKETAYTYFTVGDESTVVGAERFVLRLANMFVCDFDGDGCRPSARRRSL